MGQHLLSWAQLLSISKCDWYVEVRFVLLVLKEFATYAMHLGAIGASAQLS